MTTWFAGDDDIGRRRASAFSRRDAPELCIESFGPEKNERAQGMPGGQCTRSLVCENKQTHELVTTVTPGQPGIPYTMVLRLTSCSPRRSGLFVTVAGGYLFRQLDAGVEASEPHDLAVRKIGALVLALPASTASRPSSVTIAKRPSVGRDARDIKVILVKREREYFCKRCWTGHLAKHQLICPSGKITRGRTRHRTNKSRFSSLRPRVWCFG